MKKSLLLLLLTTAVAAAADRPNVVLIMSDDQGYGDIAAHGNPVIRTPNLDELHGESVRLTDFHVDPTCSPTRAALMTGKYSHRARVWHTVRGGNHLRRSEVTMAEVFRHNGYRTAIFGKWHLGANYPYRPIDRGFEEWLGLGDGGPGTSDCHFWTDRVNDVYWHNGEREPRDGYNVDVFFDAAIDYVKNRSADEPFFLYLPTYLPHLPYTFPSPDFHHYYVEKGIEPPRAAFFALIERVDQNIGRLRRALADEAIADNTILIFLTDNGSTQGRRSFNAGMTGGKGEVFEGGHRVPFFVRWPGGGLGRPRDVPTLSAHIDVLPTLAELCGLRLPKAIEFDGRSLAPLLKGEEAAEWTDRSLVVERQRTEARNPEDSAVMTERWRLVKHQQLFDIQADPAQKSDLAAKHPDVVERLMGAFNQHWARVTVDDRSFPAPIVGTPHDEEIFLSVSELREQSGYHHGYIADGQEARGGWHIEAAEPGVYEFEVRRWPKEAQAPFSGVPEVTKTVDSWSTTGPRETMLYEGELTALPIASVRLIVGTEQEERAVSPSDKQATFAFDLPKGRTTVEGIFLDAHGQRITNAYYVYVRKK